MIDKIPDTPESLFDRSNLWDESERWVSKKINHNEKVLVLGCDGTNLGIGRFLGMTPIDFMDEPGFMPIVEVQGHRFFGYECFWTPLVELSDDDREQLPPIFPVNEYLSIQEIRAARDEGLDKLTQIEMGIDFDQ